MSTVANALEELGIKEWVLSGEPTSEAEFKSMFCVISGADNNGTGIKETDPTKWGVTWKQVSDKLKALQDAEPMRLLRKERDRLLVETDWMALGDVTMTDAQKKYRQDLRDITKSASPKIIEDGPRTSLDMSSVTWPSKI